ncbi:MAG TPA: ATP-binding protein [Holophaga sp.]|nr:ATP-binding protein [Holophaga sp.]
MKLDLPTIVLLLGLTTLAQVAALTVQFRSNHAYRGTGWWLAGAVAFASGFLFLVVTAMTGFMGLGILANPALIFAHMAFLMGTRRFLDLPERRRWSWSALALMVGAYYVFLFLLPSLSVRTALISGFIALFDLATAATLLGARCRRFLKPARFTAAVFAAHAGLLLVLAGITLAQPPLRTYEDYSLVQVMAFLLPTVASPLWTFGFILLLNQRLDADRLASQADWRRAEQEKTALEVRNRQLQKAESLARMAGAIAHHTNNRMQTVMGALDLVGDAAPGEPFDRALGMAKVASERAVEMARLMLVYLGQASTDQALHDLSSLCRSHLPWVQSTLPPQVRFQAELPDPGPAVRANADQIHLALANLAGNALEAMGEPGGEIRIRVGTGPAAAIPEAHRFPVGWKPQPQDHAWLEVADTGVGIDPAGMEQLFDPFYSTKFTGRGLGLPVVLGIAQAHGGGVTVESRPGQGSTFRLHIPVSE